MKLTNIEYKKFSFPINNPLKNSNQSFTKKDIIILKANNDKGNTHFAEISPLPNFSKESIDDCENILQNTFANKFKLPVEFDNLKNTLSAFDKTPSLKFAFEQFVLNSYFLENREMYFNLVKQSKIKINALLSIGEVKETIKKADDFIDKGFDTIKIKIGRNSFENDLEIIKRIKEKYADRINLRLDANGIWDCNEAIDKLQQLTEFCIEFIEQPVELKDELINLAAVWETPIAPDESIETYEDAIEFIESGYFDFIVLKPSIRMGIFDTIKIIKFAEEKNVNVIITSAFETAIGRSVLLYLASLTKHKFAHGLGVELLGQEIIPDRFDIEKSYVLFDANKLPLKFYLDF